MTPVFVVMEVVTYVLLALGLWGLSRLALAIGVRTGLLCDNPGEAAALSVAYLAVLLVLLAVITLLLLPFTSPYSGLCGGSVFLALALGGLPYALTSIILSSTEGALALRGW